MCIILYLANIIVQPLLDHQFDKDAFLQTTSALFTIASLSIIEAKIMQAVSWSALLSTSIKGVNEPHQPLFRHKEKTKITTIIVMMNQESFFSGLLFFLFLVITIFEFQEKHVRYDIVFKVAYLG